MASHIRELEKRNLIHCPKWMTSNIQYEIFFGSTAYGTSSDTSDCDIYAWTIPTKEIVFPHLQNSIVGFGKQPEKFEQYQQHHVLDKDALGGKGREYDITCYGIVRYFQLCMENNPNMLETLFVPQHCVIHCSVIADMVRTNRELFLHKGAFYKYKSYAYNQLHKIRNKKDTQGKRKELIELHGHDTKFSSHAVRLVNYCIQILTEHHIDMTKDVKHLKAIRRGEVHEEDIYKWFGEKELQLEKLFTESTLQIKPDEDRIKNLLLQCLEHHYGSLEKCVVPQDKAEKAISEIAEIIQKYNIK